MNLDQPVTTYVDFMTETGHGKEQYIRRIVDEAPAEVKLIKLADVLHNLRTIGVIADAEEREKVRKEMIAQCQQHYLPLAKMICPGIYEPMQRALQEVATQQYANTRQIIRRFDQGENRE